MRHMFLLMNISLDGYVADRDGGVAGFTNDFSAFGDQSHQVDTFLFGHNTYEGMKFWDTPQGKEMMPAIAEMMTATPKVVVSHHDFDPGWQNVTVIHDDVVNSLKALKAREGNTIAVFGSNELCLTLLEAGLLDELQIIVNPVAFGEGPSLFKGLTVPVNFTLTNTKANPSGTVMLTYTPKQ